MFCKLSETFTATHLTIMFVVAALAVPSALSGAVTTSAVSITDPSTGAKSLVDAARRVYTYDPIAGYANNPANLVKLRFVTESQSGLTACSSTGYTVPAGKALVIRAVSGYTLNLSSSGGSYAFLDTNSTCASDSEVSVYGSTNPGLSPFNNSLGAGVPIPAGTTLYAYNYNCSSKMIVNGYLVPANAVPAAGTADAALQSFSNAPANHQKL